MMKRVEITYDNNVLVGFDKSDDAGIYRISDDLALVQTLDFFTPIVDDPFTFGQIAAVNALSDVYAMGGRPLTAMNIVAFPTNKFTLDILSDILRGGQDILNRAGVQLLGGHSVDDPELKYGLSITGTVHPDKIIRNYGLKAGDSIILTKPLGTGIIGTAVKAEMIEAEHLQPFIDNMKRLNKEAAEAAGNFSIHACTDVTGFGMAGHMKEMIADSPLQITIKSSSLPILPGLKEYSDMGLIPAGLYRNRDFVGDFCRIEDSVPRHLDDAVHDPQTSGGLLFAVPGEEAAMLIAALHQSGIHDAAVIAEVADAEKAGITVI